MDAAPRVGTDTDSRSMNVGRLMTAKKVGIPGSGDMDKALGRRFARHDYDVMLGTRDPRKLRRAEERDGGSM